MLFNSVQFAIFFAIVYLLYLLLNHKGQNRLLLVASYIFYGCWDWRFLSLIAISTVVDYFCGLKIYESREKRKRKLFLFISICSNLTILGFFKYFNFFTENLYALLNGFGFSPDPVFLNIILPVGISFYTFQTISYSIDIYRGELNPTRKFLDFALFVSFFPQLVAGPIERAKNLLPQMLLPRKLTADKFYEGCYLIFWGLFLKVFIADNLARMVDPVFSSSEPYDGVRVLLALYAFAFQIFGDFAGYSNIARGLAKCMGFDLMVNFNLPYFAVNPQDFWQRWHISLSTWFRDYLYIPLGGNRNGQMNTYRNLAITMLLCGLWHGAAWTFIVWGAYHALLQIIHKLLQPLLSKISTPKNVIIAKSWFFVKVVFFFHIVCLGWLIFRAESMSQVFHMLHGMLFHFDLTRDVGQISIILQMVFFLGILLIVQSFQYLKNDLMIVLRANTPVRGMFYFICLCLLLIGGVSGGQEFIYFRF